MKIIDRSFRTRVPERYYITKPAAIVKLGEEFIVETATCCQPIINTHNDVLKENYIEREETGPIFIEGIEAGDMLRINIKSIKIVGHGSGFRYSKDNDLLDYNGEIIDFIEVKEDYVVLPGGLCSQVEPMIGVICVAPNMDEPEKITEKIRYDLGDIGGNMDYKDVCAGNSICFKSENKGGLVFLGDVHAGQGWGEWLGMGIECASDVTIVVEKEDVFISDRPVLLKEKSYTCIASGWPYGDVTNMAMQDAANILVRLTGVSYFDATRYCKMLGNVKNGQIWHLGMRELPWGGPISDFPVTVGVEIPFPINVKNNISQSR